MFDIPLILNSMSRSLSSDISLSKTLRYCINSCKDKITPVTIPLTLNSMSRSLSSDISLSKTPILYQFL